MSEIDGAVPMTNLYAEAGDEIVVEDRRTGGPKREGEVLEVHRDAGIATFAVRWDDGHESVSCPDATRTSCICAPHPGTEIEEKDDDDED